MLIDKGGGDLSGGKKGGKDGANQSRKKRDIAGLDLRRDQGFED